MARFYKNPAPSENKAAYPVEEAKADAKTSADASKTDSAADTSKDKPKAAKK